MYNIVDVVKDIVTGKLEFADSTIAKDRYSICKQCEVRNKRLNICTICGCIIPLKVKLNKSNCPMDLW